MKKIIPTFALLSILASCSKSEPNPMPENLVGTGYQKISEADGINTKYLQIDFKENKVATFSQIWITTATGDTNTTGTYYEFEYQNFADTNLVILQPNYSSDTSQQWRFSLNNDSLIQTAGFFYEPTVGNAYVRYK